MIENGLTVIKEANREIEIPQELLPQMDGQVIVHLSIPAFTALAYRVWPSTFLIPSESNTNSKLLHYFGLQSFPNWTFFDYSKKFQCTLIFEALPKSCKVFDLQEIIPEPGETCIQNIKRNSTDVYFLEY